VGSGFGSFDPVYRGYEPFGDLAVTIMNQAHDDYLQIVMEAGLPGLLLLLVFLGWWGWTSVQLWRRTDDGDKALGRLGSVLILLMMLASIVDYPVRMPLIMVLAAQSAAWMLLQQRPPVGAATREAGK
jgi:O-antigen ligase